MQRKNEKNLPPSESATRRKSKLSTDTASDDCYMAMAPTDRPPLPTRSHSSLGFFNKQEREKERVVMTQLMPPKDIANASEASALDLILDASNIVSDLRHKVEETSHALQRTQHQLAAAQANSDKEGIENASREIALLKEVAEEAAQHAKAMEKEFELGNYVSVCSSGSAKSNDSTDSGKTPRLPPSP